jgi:hypothetical protein
VRQIIFNEFDMIVSAEVSDIFKWFGVNSLAGVTFAEANFMDEYKEQFDSMVNYHPNDTNKSLEYKPFIYLNTHVLSNKPIHESVMVVHHASMKLSRILTEGSDVNYDQIYKFGEAICMDVLDELNYPEVFHRV